MFFYYCKETGRFYSQDEIEDKQGFVEIDSNYYKKLIESQSPTKVISHDENGFPVISEAPPVQPLTNDIIEQLRINAYSDPLTGSDRYMIEALCLQAEGFAATSLEVKEAKAKCLKRKEEIQAMFKWLES